MSLCFNIEFMGEWGAISQHWQLGYELGWRHYRNSLEHAKYKPTAGLLFGKLSEHLELYITLVYSKIFKQIKNV